MNKIKAWVSAARLRTLPLSVSGIIVGSSMFNNPIIGKKFAFGDIMVCFSGKLHFYTTLTFWLAILTTLGLQILSNFANDYGDGVKGTDNADRVGPKRALQSGSISRKEMLKGIVITSVVTFFLAIYLIYVSFGSQNFRYSVLFFVLGLLAIAAAIKYTMGSTAYGYRGLGDVFVFIFFGLVSVVGCYFLFTKTLNVLVFLPAVTIGFLSTSVLNLNNMRDHNSDKKVGKNTLVVKLGLTRARIYHFVLVLGSMLSMLVFLFFTYTNPRHLLFLIVYIPLGLHLRTVGKTKNSELLDPELKKVALSTFFLSILFSLGQIL